MFKIQGEHDPADVKAACASFVAAQTEIGGVVRKDSANPHFASTYLSHPGLVAATHHIWNKHGFAVIQSFAEGQAILTLIEKDNKIKDANMMTVRCDTHFIHKTGVVISIMGPTVPARRNVAQDLVAASSYARRVGETAATGIAAADDDDGNAASGRPSAPASQPQAPAPQAPPPAAASPEGIDPDGYIGFGKRKGEHISTLEDRSFSWYLENAQKTVADPAKAKWRENNERFLNACLREQARRAGGGAPQQDPDDDWGDEVPPPDDDLPF